MVAVAAAASADPEVVVHMAEVIVLESVAPEWVVTEMPLKAGSVDQEVLDMAEEEADTAVGSADC